MVAHHKKKYGHPKKKGYIEIIEQFDPSGFDAAVWAELFKKSGAKFAASTATSPSASGLPVPSKMRALENTVRVIRGG